MKFNFNENKPVVVLLGAGAMGNAIVKRVAANKTILLGDISEKNLKARADELRSSGYDVQTMVVDALDNDSVEAFAKKAAQLGTIKYFIDTAGSSPNQATPQEIIDLDLIATAHAIDIFSKYVTAGTSGIIISSQTGYMMEFSHEVEHQLALTPSDKLRDLDFVKNDAVADPGIAYIAAKRCNHLRVQIAAATTWGDRGARINTISPGIIVTPLAYDEFKAAGEGYQKMIETSPAKRVAAPDEIARTAEFLLSDDASFITGIDILVDGGIIASMKAGRYQLG